jgi:hypothetical protein
MAAIGAGWSYRKSFTFSRASGAVTNYQMKIKVGESSGATGEDVDCGGLCRTDMGDLRFTNAAGTLLDYYVEDLTGTTPNQLATIWVELDSVGTGATTFYMYYGKSDATTESNGPNTFLYFDDFNSLNDGDLNGQNGWTASGNGLTWDVATTTKYEGAKAAQCGSGSATSVANKTITGWNLWLQCRARSSSVASANQFDIYFWEGAGQNTALSLDASKIKHLTKTLGWQDVGFGATANNTWYKLRMALDAKTTHKIWVNDTAQTPSQLTNYVDVVTACTKIQIENYFAAGTSVVDQILIGQYLATEPAFGAWGSQETPGSAVAVFVSQYRRRWAA